jgi:Methyltransferase small domain
VHEDGSVGPELVSLISRAAVERALFVEPAGSAIHVVYQRTDCPESSADVVLRLSREAMLMGIPGFFPSPATVAEQLVRFANFCKPAGVLEPSAGSGCLIDAVRKHHPDTRISYCEINCLILDLLRAKYGGSGNVHFIGRDFIELDISNLGSSFDGIIMNPPFENGEDIAHVMHAHKFLSSKGILAAIVSEGAFHRNDKGQLPSAIFLRLPKRSS